MKTEKIRSYVGFAIKAGKVKIGIDNILSAKKNPFVVLYDEKLSDNSKRKLLSGCEKTVVYSAPMSEIMPRQMNVLQHQSHFQGRSCQNIFP